MIFRKHEFKFHIFKLHPATLVLLSFIMAIVTGAFLLKLPTSTHAGEISLINAVFTATSAVCVTGLIVVDTGGYFTFFGQCVILALIQIGGLGVMTISVLMFRMIGRSISFRQHMAIQDLFAHTPRRDIFKLLKNIVLFTFITEMAGANLLFFGWMDDFPLSEALYLSVFHSVSAFCNAGFSLFSDSLMQYRGDYFMNIVFCLLIIIGGIGFPVLYDIKFWFTGRGEGGRARLSVQTKTVLTTTLFLIVLGAVLYAFLERPGPVPESALSDRLLTPIFQSVTCRTAGFNTVDIASLSAATVLMMIFLMFFGASPGSCGGGVKTTTLALISAFTFSRMRRKRRVNLFKKSVPAETINRSVSLILISTGIIMLVLFLILLSDRAAGRDSFLAYFFETVSAFGTVGLSMGITPLLNVWGKSWIIIMMIIGRVGVLTVSYIIVGTGRANGLEYSEENIMIG